MIISILGAGLLGSLIARELVSENRDVVLIEKNPNIARSIANELDCIVEEGDGENIDTLTAAGVADAEWFIACTGSDETNIVACGLVAENFTSVKTIARVRNPYFASFKGTGKKILGIDALINPEAETAEAIARIIFRGMSPEIIDVKEAGIQLRLIHCNQEPRFLDRPLIDIRAAIGLSSLYLQCCEATILSCPMAILFLSLKTKPTSSVNHRCSIGSLVPARIRYDAFVPL